MQITRNKIGFSLIILLSIVAIFFLASTAPIAQDPKYHEFADRRALLLIPNFYNVVSNLPFLVVGALGLYRLNHLQIVASNKTAYIAVFLGVTLVAVGSAYYHLWPDNQTLVWDRLPMTIAFMGLFSVIIGERLGEKLGKTLCAPLLFIGMLAVGYWWYTELQGKGDLRFYAIVQFYPMLVIPVILLFFSPRYSGVSAYWVLLATYLMAKLFEHFDRLVFDYLGFISGHSIKHILPAIGIYYLIISYQERRDLGSPELLP